MLRVITGKYGKRKLSQPDLKITRPTSDRIKESIFSIIQFNIENKIFLDLFSGSGSIAIEAVSRGAMKAIAIESNHFACKVIKDNLVSLKISNVDLLKSDAIGYLTRSKGNKFDFIYVDPPFESNLYNEVLDLIKINDLLNKNGNIIIETNSIEKIKIPHGYLVQNKKIYGKKIILFVSKNN